MLNFKLFSRKVAINDWDNVIGVSLSVYFGLKSCPPSI